MIREYIQTISNYKNLIINEAFNSWSSIIFNQKEPDIIRDYLLKNNSGVDYLNENIAKQITNQTKYELKFASVYCHQKPRVQRTDKSKEICIGDTDGCELGDLMIVFLLLDKNKKVVCSTAKIMQAKKTEKLDSASQKCLYESDLEFKMPNNIVTASTNNDSLRILPNYDQHRNMALSYLILNNKYPYNKAIPSNSNLRYSWGVHLQLLLEFKTGLKFLKSPQQNDNGWDCIINDLLNVGKGLVGKKRQINRGYGLDYFIDKFNDYKHLDNYFIKTEGPGIPTLLIFCKDTERAYEEPNNKME